MTTNEDYIVAEEINLTDEMFRKISGAMDCNLIAIEKQYNVHIVTSGNGIKLNGQEENVNKCKSLILLLIKLSRQGHQINKLLIENCREMLEELEEDEILDMYQEVEAVTAKGKKIYNKTPAQRDYSRSIRKNTITFGIGPAGTGKTFLAVAHAVKAYKKGEVDKIILTRPAIEAGEKLGFLPGDMQMKVDPYLRPLYDALEEMFGVTDYMSLIEKGIIEVAPLAFMRGRTLGRAFIILDEAQNTTEEQMKMFLTRMGEGSKLVVTGDLTQIDLPQGGRSGLKQAVEILNGIKDIGICRLTDKDVVRHELVRQIVNAYEKAKENFK